MKISEVIVVEGINDQKRISQAVDAETLSTSGTHVSKELLIFLKEVHKQRGIIVFTDPDSPGAMIRRKITEEIPDCKHASLSHKQARNSKKVGIEHASLEDIREALKEVVTFSKVNVSSLLWSDFVDLNLTGFASSQQLRDVVCAHFKLPYCNGKTCFKYLNMLHLTKDDVMEALYETHR